MAKMTKWQNSLTGVVKRYPGLFAISGLFSGCLIFFHQPLFSGGIINATDLLTQQYFWNSFIKENLLADPCFQTWLPYVNAGTPFSGGLDLLFRPVTFLTLLLLPVHVAINYEMIIYIFLLGVGMYFYMRELEVSPLSAFLSALVLMLNGEIVTLLNAGHVNKIGAIAPVTFVFWALERALQRNTLRAYLWAGVALGIQFWQGHVQISFYTCLAVGIYYLVRISVMLKQDKQAPPVWRLTTYAVLMVIVFLLLSAVTFLPLISFAQVSDRAEGVSYEFATSWSMPPEELLTYIIPGFFGLRRANHFEDEPDIQRVEYWGRMPFTQTGRYFGIFPLLFMFLALCFVRSKHVLTLAVIALISLLLGMGQYIPTYKLLYQHFPGFNMFRAPQMILFLFAFAASGLAGFGAEWFLSDFSEKKDRQLRLFLLIGIVLVVCAWVLTFVLPQLKPTLLTQFNETLSRKGGTPELPQMRLNNIVRGCLQFDLLLSIALLLIGFRLARQVRLRWIVSAVLFMYLLDIWLFNEKYIDTVPIQDSFYVNENDAIRYVKAHPGYYRILQMTNTPETYNVFNKYVTHHLFSVSGYEAVGVQYYNEYLENMALGNTMVDLLNIKYLIFPKEAQFDDQPVTVGRILGPYKVVLNADAVVLENLNVLPRAYPVHQAYVIQDRQERLGALNDPQFNPREAVILEDYPQINLAPTDLPSAQSQAEITHYLNRTIQVKATMATDGFLMLSEKYYSGWKAYVDGQPTKIYRANHTLQAIVVPQGKHLVTFAFQPTQFLLGLIVTCLTGLGLGIYAIVSHVRTRRSPRDILTPDAVTERSAWFRIPLTSSQVLWGIVGIGCLLHVSQYLFNRSLHVDEASLALNILSRSFSGLWQPLDSHQGAPPGFLMIEKVLTTIFGGHEYALRLFPFVSIVASLFLLARLAAYYTTPSAVPFVLGLFALSAPLLIFASTVKQYACDVFFALLLYWLVVRVQESRFARADILAFGVGGTIALWCSHPAVFVLAGLGSCLIIKCLRDKQWHSFLQLSGIALFWLCNFGALYLISLQQLQRDPYLTNFWAGAYVPFPPTSLAEATWLVRVFIEFVGYAVGLSQAIFDTITSHSLFKLLHVTHDMIKAGDELGAGQVLQMFFFALAWTALYGIALYFMIIGAMTVFVRQRKNFWLLLAPVGFTVLAGVIQAFPLPQRLLLFLIPTCLLLIGMGIARMLESRQRLLGWVLAGCLFAYPALSAGDHFLHPRTDQELRPVLQYIHAHQQAQDGIYVYYAAAGMFRYYNQWYHFDFKNPIIGVMARENPEQYRTDVEQLKGKRRVWIVFAHVFGDEEQRFLYYLDQLGTRLDTVPGIKASAYLYDFGATSHE